MQDRIKHLFAIRDELDKELESLMGRRDTFEAARPWHCVRCSYEWRSRLPHRPRQCPKCKSKRFDTPPLYTYQELVARKAAKGKLPLVETVVQPAPLAHSVLSRQVPQITAPLEEEPVTSIALTPPPVLPQTTMTLRERLAQIRSSAPTPKQEQSASAATQEEPVVLDSVSEDELVEAINGDLDAT
jgi:predicted Zn-ribbon and HTH transcriptional regulator